MVWTKLKWTAAMLLVGCAVGSASVALRSSRAADPPATTAPADRGPAKKRQLPPEDPARRRIEEALKQPVSLTLENVGLANALGRLAGECRVNIVLDPRALSDEGLTTATPVTLAVADLPLRTTLKLLLKPLGLIYKIEDNVVMITTPAKPALRVYVSRPRRDGLSVQESLRLQEELVKDIEQRTPYKTVGSPEQADLIVIPTPKMRGPLEQLLRTGE